MLTQIARNTLVQQSEFLQSNAVVVQGRTGVLLIDPGIQGDEMAALANDLRELNQSVVAGFSTHPHWDHLLWHTKFGEAPRYGTARCAAAIRDLLSDAGWKARVAKMLPPDIAEEIPLDDLFGLITGLRAKTARIPWDGPQVRITEHQAHAPGHAALLIENERVLVAGDMLSDVLIPMLNLNGEGNPVQDYLDALRRLEDIASKADIVIPGHGSAGSGDEIRRRIDQDRAYVLALREGHDPVDARVGPAATFGRDWLPGVHARQVREILNRAS